MDIDILQLSNMSSCGASFQRWFRQIWAWSAQLEPQRKAGCASWAGVAIPPGGERAVTAPKEQELAEANSPTLACGWCNSAPRTPGRQFCCSGCSPFWSCGRRAWRRCATAATRIVAALILRVFITAVTCSVFDFKASLAGIAKLSAITTMQLRTHNIRVYQLVSLVTPPKLCSRIISEQAQEVI